MKTYLCGCSSQKACADHSNQFLSAEMEEYQSTDRARRAQETAWRDVDALLQTGVKVSTLRSCVLRHLGCEGVSGGSVGAADGFCSVFCPSCRRVEDGAVLASLRNQGRVINEVLAPTPLTTLEVQ